MIKTLKEVAYYYYVKNKETGTLTDITCLPEEEQKKICKEAYQKLAEVFGYARSKESGHSGLPD